jgi:Adenylate and Guanylate cyclase catalytic domain
MREIIGSYHRCCATSIERNGGFVAKYMGDGVLAYFGFPHAHEDDAERAVRAGVDIVAVVTNLETAAKEQLKVHIGIATGIVVVGDLVGQGSAQEQAVVALDLFGWLVDRLPDLRVLLVLTFRPEFVAPLVGRANVATLSLGRFGRRQAVTMIEQVPAASQCRRKYSSERRASLQKDDVQSIRIRPAAKRKRFFPDSQRVRV